MMVAGVMSGTSLDGIDVALVEIRERRRPHVVAHATTPYPGSVRKALLGVSNTQTHTAVIARLHYLLPELYAEAVRRLCETSGVRLDLAGCHGQTIYHEGAPIRFLGRRVASTLQIGDGSVLAERLGVPVVSGFRARDIAAGGQGAPLVPYVDYLLYRHPKRGRVSLNIGGIANVTAIPPGGAPEDVIAFDTGPGNMVIDALASAFTGGALRFDRGGRVAARGAVNRDLLNRLMRDRFYRRAPAKSAGREQYGAEYIARLRATELPIEDLIATVTVLTPSTIGAAIRDFIAPRMRVDDLIVSGGGVHNPRLMGYLAAFVPGVRILTSSDFGIDPDAKEAIAFAILAYETWHRRPSNLPAATGARRAVVLGKISP